MNFQAHKIKAQTATNRASFRSLVSALLNIDGLKRKDKKRGGGGGDGGGGRDGGGGGGGESIEKEELIMKRCILRRCVRGWKLAMAEMLVFLYYTYF